MPTHISCAYRLEGATGPYLQEGYDDKEHGAGRAILSTLKKASVQAIAVYVVRYYGGIQLGPRRYAILRELTDAAISTYQRRAREKRARLFRADSQESLDSVLSALSFQKPRGRHREH